MYCRIPWFGEVAATSSIADTSRSGKGGSHQLWWKRRSEILLTIICDCVHHTEMGKSPGSSDPGHSNRFTDALANLLSCTWSIWTSIMWICVCLCITASELFCKIFISMYNFFNLYDKNEDALHSHQLMQDHWYMYKTSCKTLIYWYIFFSLRSVKQNSWSCTLTINLRICCLFSSLFNMWCDNHM